VVSVLVIEPKFRGFKPGRVRMIFMAIKIRSMTSFGEEVKPSVSCKVLWHVKEPYRYEKRYFVGKIHGYFSTSLF
jgi:hypothetical protein